jgi:ABC-2 type transport system ATP-binding protein
MLEVKALEKSYGSKHAVRGVSFAVEKGTVLGFLGPNGAGKSTTMRMIAGVLEPDSGDALIDGKSIISDRRAAQASLGYLPEGAPLYEDMTPPEFLRFLAEARALPRKSRRDAVDRAIADARILSVSHQRIGDLSTGYRRRVGLAGAILHDPPVLVLDEPTDGLDPNQKRAVRAHRPDGADQGDHHFHPHADRSAGHVPPRRADRPGPGDRRRHAGRPCAALRRRIT